MKDSDPQTLVEEATFDFAMNDNQAAIEKLEKALEIDPNCFEALHALTEIYLSEKKLENALEAAEAARKLDPEDIHINTSLSRIWVEFGNKEKAEYFGAQARMLGWKEEIQAEN